MDNCHRNRGSTPLASKYFEINHLCGRGGKSDNKSDNTSDIFRHYPVAFSRFHANLRARFPCEKELLRARRPPSKEGPFGHPVQFPFSNRPTIRIYPAAPPGRFFLAEGRPATGPSSRGPSKASRTHEFGLKFIKIFRLTAFFGDFRRNHQFTKAHKYA